MGPTRVCDFYPKTMPHCVILQLMGPFCAAWKETSDLCNSSWWWSTLFTLGPPGLCDLLGQLFWLQAGKLTVPGGSSCLWGLAGGHMK
jgi:hypothetical protein